MIVDMNYQKIYNDIIEKARSENRIKHIGTYYENHHIIPKCLNGIDEKENRVLLTAKEHYLCHKLLIFIYPNNKLIIWAFHRLTYDNLYRNRNITSRDYQYARESLSKILTGKPPWNKNKHLTKEHCENMGNARKGKKHSEETLQKMKNHIFSKEHKQKLKESRNKRTKEIDKKQSESVKGEKNHFFGRTRESESIEKMKNTQRLNMVICEYCEKECYVNIYNRFHGEKCKHKIK
jgi:hypothetical protein